MYKAGFIIRKFFLLKKCEGQNTLITESSRFVLKSKLDSPVLLIFQMHFLKALLAKNHHEVLTNILPPDFNAFSSYQLLTINERTCKFKCNWSKSYTSNWLLSLTVHSFFLSIKGPFPPKKSLSFACNNTSTSFSWGI